MANLDIRPSDLVVTRLTLRSRDGKTTELNVAPLVSQLPLKAVKAGTQPEFPTANFTTAALAGDAKEMCRIQATFNDAMAGFIAAGATPPGECLAQAIVDFVIATRPNGDVYTTDKNAREGFILSTDEINISGPHELGADRSWRVLASATWGAGV
jgi:hypothetical protein